MDERGTSIARSPAWIYWVAAGFCLLGPFVLRYHPVMGAEAQLVGHFVGVPLAVVSVLLSLGLRGSVPPGWRAWVVAALWLAAMVSLFVPVRTWASQEGLSIDWYLVLPLAATFAASALGLLLVSLRVLGGHSGWRGHVGPRILLSAALLLLVLLLGRAASLVYASHLALLHSGLQGWVTELARARVVTLLCAAALVGALGWRHVAERASDSQGQAA